MALSPSILIGGRHRRRSPSLQVALALARAALVVLAAVLLLWVLISLGGYLIGDWMLVPLALGIALLARGEAPDALRSAIDPRTWISTVLPRRRRRRR